MRYVVLKQNKEDFMGGHACQLEYHQKLKLKLFAEPEPEPKPHHLKGKIFVGGWVCVFCGYYWLAALAIYDRPTLKSWSMLVICRWVFQSPNLELHVATCAYGYNKSVSNLKRRIVEGQGWGKNNSKLAISIVFLGPSLNDINTE